MNPEQFPQREEPRKEIEEAQPEPIASSEKILPSEPKLRYLLKALELLKPGNDALGNEVRWQNLDTQVPSFENAIELSDAVRETVRTYVLERIPSLKEKIPSIQDLNDSALLDALTHNWFEGIDEQVDGQRRHVLLAVTAHVVRRIENGVYQKILQKAPEEDLGKLGLVSSTRDLTVELMRVASKADPLFIRFLAYTQFSGKPPENASSSAMFLPHDETPHTLATLFPHEARFLSLKLDVIAEQGGEWLNEEGGKEFQEYLKSLSSFFDEKDPKMIASLEKKVQEQYEHLLSSSFPILFTPPTEGYVKEPYTDPELRISLSTPDARKEEDAFKKAQAAMADSLETLGVSQFSDSMKTKTVRSVQAMGSYGVNLVMNAVAQEKPAIVVYLNEQLRAYDRDFPDKMNRVENKGAAFSEGEGSEQTRRMEHMSRMNTVLHELSHCVYPDGSEDAKRLGRGPLTILDEVKAEIFYRPLVPHLLQEQGLEGTEEQWAVGMLTTSLQMLKDNPEGDPYYYAAVYTLNALLEEGVLVAKGEQIRITDFKRYYALLQEQTQDVLALYEDAAMNERKAASWIKERCAPNEKVRQLKIALGVENAFDKNS